MWAVGLAVVLVSTKDAGWVRVWAVGLVVVLASSKDAKWEAASAAESGNQKHNNSTVRRAC